MKIDAHTVAHFSLFGNKLLNRSRYFKTVYCSVHSAKSYCILTINTVPNPKFEIFNFQKN